MSMQLDLNASHYVSTETEPTACLNHWPLPGWRLITTPSRLRYVQLQQRAEHFETRQIDVFLTLMRLNTEQDNGIDHRARIARVERIAQRTQQQASAALAELFAESDRLRSAHKEA